MSGILMGRLTTAEKVVDLVSFMCSPVSSYMVGCGLITDGGMGMSLSAMT